MRKKRKKKQESSTESVGDESEAGRNENSGQFARETRSTVREERNYRGKF